MVCLPASLRLVNMIFQFVSSELGHSGPEKSHNLHRNDLSITFEELWDSWLKSEGNLT